MPCCSSSLRRRVVSMRSGSRGMKERRRWPTSAGRGMGRIADGTTRALGKGPHCKGCDVRAVCKTPCSASNDTLTVIDPLEHTSPWTWKYTELQRIHAARTTLRFSRREACEATPEAHHHTREASYGVDLHATE